MFGELETRFKVRGCCGDWGIEIDLLSPLRAEFLTMSLEDSFRRTGAGALIASVRDFRVALITSVASIDLSFGDRCSSSCSREFSCSAFFVRDLTGGFVAFDFTPEAVLFKTFERPGTLESFGIAFGNKRSLRVVAVAGVQVDVEPTDARTASVAACNEAIMIGKKRQMYSC